MRYITLLALLLMLVGTQVPAQAQQTVTVGSGAGTCTEAAFDAGLAQLMPTGGTLNFNCGGAATIKLTQQKLFTGRDKTFIIDGSGVITLDGQNQTRIFQVANSTFSNSGNLNLRLRGLTLRNGRAAGYSGNQDTNQGGAVLFGYGNGRLTIEDSRFINNSAVTDGFQWDGGGAIHIRIGELFVHDSEFIGNRAPNGGAMNILITSGEITNSVFRQNVATISGRGGGGGAIYIDNGKMTIAHSQIIDNQSSRFGGGYFNCGGSKNIGFETIEHTIVRGNVITADGATGAGVYNCNDGITLRFNEITNNSGPSHAGGFWHYGEVASHTATVANTTISNNTVASGNGGGITNNGVSTMTILHSTIAHNRSGVLGSGIFTASNATTRIQNSIVANNESGHEWNQEQCNRVNNIVDLGGNLNFPAQIGKDSALCKSSFTLADPLLRALAANGSDLRTHSLAPNSPAVDATSCVVGFDQRGISRPQGAACDSGAYERIAGNRDVNNDGIISPTDMIYVVNRLGSSNAAADVNGDGTVNKLDVDAIVGDLQP